MGNLTIAYLNPDTTSYIFVTPMRPEDGATFSDDDCPEGNISITYKASMILRNTHKMPVDIPTMTKEERNELIKTKKNELKQVKPGKSDKNKKPKDQTEVEEPTEDQIKTRRDKERGFTDEDVQNYIDTKKLWDEASGTYIKPSVERAKQNLLKPGKTEYDTTSIIDMIVIEKKSDLAQLKAEYAIEECLELPAQVKLKIKTGKKATYDSTSNILMDTSATYITDGVTTDHFVKFKQYLYKIVNVISETELQLEKDLALKDETKPVNYKIYSSPFLTQFKMIRPLDIPG